MVKSKTLKDELKYDIYVVNEEIDTNIDLIGKEFVIESLESYQNSHAKYLEAQLEGLKVEKEKLLGEFTSKAFKEEEPRSVFLIVQKVLDARLVQVKKLSFLLILLYLL